MIRVGFELETPSEVRWRIIDPVSGALLSESEWIAHSRTQVDLKVGIPGDEGDYRVEVGPPGDRFVLLDVRVNDGRVAVSAPKVSSVSGLRFERLCQAVPKAFVYPVRSIWRHRKLMASMVKRDILARYRGSFGGALWTFLNPLLLMATYFFVFGVVLRTRFGADTSRSGFVLYFLAGMLPWLAFSEAVGRSSSIILEYRNFVKKLVFPLETLPVNLVISGAVTELFALAIFIAGLLIARGSVPVRVIWLPAIVIPQLLLTAGICWFLAAAGVFLRDLGQIMSFLLTLWFFVTPICYPESAIPAGAAKILVLNPIYVLVRSYRAIFLENQAPALPSLVALGIGSIVLAVLGHGWFHKLRKSFADVI